MYNVTSMFKCDKYGTTLAGPMDPKLLAVDHALHQYRQNMEDAPVATIEIKIPVEVCNDPKSWTYKCNNKKRRQRPFLLSSNAYVKFMLFRRMRSILKYNNLKRKNLKNKNV